MSIVCSNPRSLRVLFSILSLLPVDDCWSVKGTRNATTHRIIPNPSTFPQGISGVAKQVHGLGLKIGIYSSEYFQSSNLWDLDANSYSNLGAGETTCAGYPASLGYEKIDAAAFAEWGIDCKSNFQT